MSTRPKCFSQDTEACPDPRSPPLCTHLSGATRCVTPPLTLSHTWHDPEPHFSLQSVPQRLTKRSDSCSCPEQSMWSFYDIRGVKGHDHFSSRNETPVDHSTYYIVLFSDHCLYWIWSLCFYEEADLLRTDPHYKLGRKLTEQLFLMETFTGLKTVLWHPQQHRPS